MAFLGLFWLSADPLIGGGLVHQGSLVPLVALYHYEIDGTLLKVAYYLVGLNQLREGVILLNVDVIIPSRFPCLLS